MNQLDVITAAIEHAVPESRLVRAADLAASGAGRQEVASSLAPYQPTETLTGGGRFLLDDAGITGVPLLDGHPATVTWSELAAYLCAAVTGDSVDELRSLYRPSPQPGASGAVPADVSSWRASLAYDVAGAAGLVAPSLFADSLVRRTVLAPVAGGDGWGGEVALDPIDTETVACTVNGVLVATVRHAATAHHVVVQVPDPTGGAGWAGLVRHVPPGDTPGPLPATFAARVGAEVLDADPDGARWAVQVDGFDVIIMEAGPSTARPSTVLRAAVYDNDPAHPFQRHEAHHALPTAAAPAAPDGPTSATQRLQRLRRRLGGRGR